MNEVNQSTSCWWSVKEPESNNCFVRVRHDSLAYPGSEDTNDTAFSIVPSITVTNPKVNQKVVAGTNVIIKWTTGGSVPKVFSASSFASPGLMFPVMTTTILAGI